MAFYEVFRRHSVRCMERYNSNYPITTVTKKLKFTIPIIRVGSKISR